MSYDEIKNTITLDPNKLSDTDSGKWYRLELKLVDDKGGLRINFLTVRVPVKYVAPPIVIPEVEEEVVEEFIEPCSAAISSISSEGLVRIVFNHTMLTTGFNISLFNSTTFDMYINPSQNRHLQG